MVEMTDWKKIANISITT